MSRKKLCPVYDPNCQKYIDDPSRTFYMGLWRTQGQIERRRVSERERRRVKYATDPEYRERKRERDRKRKSDPEWRERKRESDRKRRSDPEYRRRKTIYMLHYHHAKKKERYGDQGLTLGNDGQEDRQGRDRTAA